MYGLAGPPAELNRRQHGTQQADIHTCQHLHIQARSEQQTVAGEAGCSTER